MKYLVMIWVILDIHFLNSREILYSQGKNDECYTPHYGVTPILKYIPEGKIVWCPFDKEDSEFVKQIREPIVHSHIDDGQDFFNYEPDEWDIIVSNPPFTNKRKYFVHNFLLINLIQIYLNNFFLNLHFVHFYLNNNFQ